MWTDILTSERGFLWLESWIKKMKLHFILIQTKFIFSSEIIVPFYLYFRISNVFKFCKAICQANKQWQTKNSTKTRFGVNENSFLGELKKFFSFVFSCLYKSQHLSQFPFNINRHFKWKNKSRNKVEKKNTKKKIVWKIILSSILFSFSQIWDERFWKPHLSTICFT